MTEAASHSETKPSSSVRPDFLLEIETQQKHFRNQVEMSTSFSGERTEKDPKFVEFLRDVGNEARRSKDL